MDKVAIVTGSSGGIGQALCRAFGQAKHRVVGVDKVENVAYCDSYVQADLNKCCTDERYRSRILSDIRRSFAGLPLAVLINNAALQIVKSTVELTVDDWIRTLHVNVLAPFVLIQALLSHLVDGKGSIINIGSVHATVTKPGFVAYATSKAALEGMTRSMAVEFGEKVRVNAIAPAAVDTPMLRDGFSGDKAMLDTLAQMHPVGRIGDPDEIAKAALFLASPGNTFINGTILGVDGGIRGRLYDPL